MYTFGDKANVQNDLYQPSSTLSKNSGQLINWHCRKLSYYLLQRNSQFRYCFSWRSFGTASLPRHDMSSGLKSVELSGHCSLSITCGQFVMQALFGNICCVHSSDAVWDHRSWDKTGLRPKKIALCLARCGLGLDLAGLVLCCDTRSCHARRHNDLEGRAATFQVPFIVSLFCAWNLTTVEITYWKVKFTKCLCLLPVVLDFWSWSCYFSLGLKNLVLFTSLVHRAQFISLNLPFHLATVSCSLLWTLKAEINEQLQLLFAKRLPQRLHHSDVTVMSCLYWNKRKLINSKLNAQKSLGSCI